MAVETLTRWDVCNIALKWCPRFLEIGVSGGRAGRAIHANLKIGVDPVLKGDFSGYTTVYGMTSDAFFAQQRESLKLGAVLIDGDHEAGQVLCDIEHALEHLVPDGAIIVHDCNPQDEQSQIVPRPVGQYRWNGDCWKAIVTLRATRPDLSVVTLDSDEGLGLIRVATTPQPLIPMPSELTWPGLVANRRDWLGLVDTW